MRVRSQAASEEPVSGASATRRNTETGNEPNKLALQVAESDSPKPPKIAPVPTPWSRCRKFCGFWETVLDGEERIGFRHQ